MFRKAITIILLAFVASSILYLVYDELIRASSGGPEAAAPDSAAPDTMVPRKLVVYYFWELPRCDTCLKLEGYAEEALRNGFPEELKSGLLQWRAVNVGEPALAHFVKDYELFTKALVISDVRHGKEAKWKNLDKIWDLVADKGEYVKYVQGEVAMALKEAPGAAEVE